MTEEMIIDAIVELLDGKTWSPDTLQAIADLLRNNGYEIRDSEDRD